MSLNNRLFWLNDDEYYLLKKEDKLMEPAFVADISKIFLLELKRETSCRSEFFYDGESDEAVLGRVSFKPFRKRRL